MIIREANTKDISQMHKVRVMVRENILPDPSMITEQEYKDFMLHRGKGWVCEIDETIVGFSIVSVLDKNVWALFVEPGQEGKGIGKKLHDEMLNWYFLQTNETIWLGTAPKTKAERFYQKAGWTQTGVRSNGEIRFEMKKSDWEKLSYPVE